MMPMLWPVLKLIFDYILSPIIAFDPWLFTITVIGISGTGWVLWRVK